MQYFDLATTTLGAGAVKPVEEKIPLWWSDGTSVSMNSSYYLLNDGSTTTTVYSSNAISSEVLHTLSAKWPTGTQFALEVTMGGNTGGVNAQLYHVTVGSAPIAVAGTLVQTTSSTTTAVRSAQFTLTDGFSYGVGVCYSVASGGNISDASLIVFPN